MSQLKLLIYDMQNLIENVVSKDVLEKIGKELSNDIRTRTKMGKVADTFGSMPSKIARLAPSTIKMRQSSKLYFDTSPSTSNLTLSGRMLDSIGYKIGHNTVSITIEGIRNQNIAGYHMAGNEKLPKRPFFNLDKYNIDRAELLVLAAFDDFILRKWKNR